jgi:O-antigen/teichoic acid export membrane protein
MSKILIKNAFSNICRGASSALAILLMPPFLIKFLSKDAYGTWLLILQLSAYVSFLDFGVQTAVGRFVAHSNEIGDQEKRNKIVSTSLAILTVLAIVATVGIAFLVFLLPSLFPQMPLNIQKQAQWALSFVGVSLAISLPFSVFNGIFMGLQRYDIIATIVGVSKLLGATFTVCTAYLTHSIISMAAVMALSNLIGCIWQYLAYAHLNTEIKIKSVLVDKKEGAEILDYCTSLMVWSFGMLLVSGLDIVIVGYYDYQAVVYYAVSSSLITFIIGLQGSLFSVLTPHAAVLSAREESNYLGELLLKATRYGLLVLLLVGLPIITFAKEILSLWIGKEYGEAGALILQILIAANIIRLIGAPYTTMVVGVGQQKLIILSPIIESIVNLLLSIILGKLLGGKGVAIGTFIGSFVSIGGHVLYNMPRTKKITFFKIKYLYQSIFIPIFCFAPIILYLFIKFLLQKESTATIELGVSCALLSLVLVLFVGISSAERAYVWKTFKQKMP